MKLGDAGELARLTPGFPPRPRPDSTWATLASPALVTESSSGNREELLHTEYEPDVPGPTKVGHHRLEQAPRPVGSLATEAKEKPELLLRARFVVCLETVGAIDRLSPRVWRWMSHQRTAVAA